jgi:hypothetical protein
MHWVFSGAAGYTGLPLAQSPISHSFSGLGLSVSSGTVVGTPSTQAGLWQSPETSEGGVQPLEPLELVVLLVLVELLVLLVPPLPPVLEVEVGASL